MLKKWVMHYRTERYYVMTWTERWVVRIFQPLTDSLVLHNTRGQWRKSIRPTHSNKKETEREEEQSGLTRIPQLGGQLDTGSPLTAVSRKKGSCILTQVSYLPPSHTFKHLRLPELFPTIYNYSYRFAEGVRLGMHKNTYLKDQKPLMCDF